MTRCGSHGVVELSDGERVRDFRPGMFHYVGESDDVKFNSPQGAPVSFAPYMEHEGRTFAAGAGSPYEMLTGKWAGIPYNGARIITNIEDANIDVLQMGHFKTIVVLYQHFVTRGINVGIIDVDPLAYRAEPWLYWAMRLIPPARASIDPSREDRNDLVNVEACVQPHSDIVERKTGQPAETVYRRIKRNRALMTENGLEIHMPNMGRDPGSDGTAPTQPGDTNQESSDANNERQAVGA
jgi:capsid protein